MLRVTGLSHTYANGVRALDDVSLELEAGLFGLLGPNGAGKSTLLRTLATLQRPDRGAITLDGVDALADPLTLRRQLGYLPQEFGVYPRVSARALLDHLAVLKGLDEPRARRRQVDALLELVGLAAVRSREVSTFSGGMRQRFGIAQALLGAPRLLIVDEPTAGLDPEERNRFHNLLAEVAGRCIVLLSTHLVDDVVELCPRCAVLVAGRVVLEGAPAALVSRLTGRVWSRPTTREEADALRPLSTRLEGGVLRARVLGDAAPAAGFSPATPTLEDVYFAALQGRA